MNKFARGTLEENNPYLSSTLWNIGGQTYTINYYKELVEKLDRIIYNAPRFDFPIFCYRGIGLQKGHDVKLEENILNDMGFKSCSLSPQVCLGFSGDDLKLILLQIRVKKNIPILLMENCNSRIRFRGDKIVNEMFREKDLKEIIFDGNNVFTDLEDEILFPRNVRLRTIDTLESVEQAYKEFFRNDAKLLQIDVETI
jgi:hypothetical protein